ncbi:peptidoglycan-binding protein [Streptomyces sp. NPDC008086]|uniref:peptidoglycan-binding domain-containing protein n=1 Tax=Streptomyces sp. NPDC008086 TaxID=3364807 RepID=UPI0036EC6E30
MSEALRDARTAEAAAAEDFDPLRIRPYVELEAGGDHGAAATMPLRPVAPGPGPAPAPSTPDLSLFEPPAGAPHADAPDPAAPRHRRTRSVLLLGTGGALVAVIAAAGLASGLFTYETPSRDTALPDAVRASVPAPSSSEASQSPSRTRTQSAPPPAPPAPTRSAPPSPSPSRSSASPAPSPSTEPTTTTSTPSPTDSAAAQEASAAARDPAPPTLRRGDRGSEVVELELRLTQLGLYPREARGSYNEGVEDAVSRYQWARGVQPEEYGVYDLPTRERLESETREP